MDSAHLVIIWQAVAGRHQRGRWSADEKKETKTDSSFSERAISSAEDHTHTFSIARSASLRSEKLTKAKLPSQWRHFDRRAPLAQARLLILADENAVSEQSALPTQRRRTSDRSG